jgi:hypothetical protein
MPAKIAHARGRTDYIAGFRHGGAMPRIPMDAFEEGTEIVRVYLAATQAEAADVEAALDAAGASYAVEVESFPSGALLGSAERRFAGFWVREAELDGCADALERAGHRRGLVER